MGFAYLDKYGIMHIVDEPQTADEYASGNVVKTEIAHDAGWPEQNGEHIIVYTKEGKFKVNKVEHPIADLPKTYPHVAALVDLLK